MTYPAAMTTLPMSDDEYFTEYGYECALCGERESWTTEAAHLQSALWHVYSIHPRDWREKYGDELPGRRPEELGVRFQGWESQL